MSYMWWLGKIFSIFLFCFLIFPFKALAVIDLTSPSEIEVHPEIDFIEPKGAARWIDGDRSILYFADSGTGRIMTYDGTNWSNLPLDDQYDMLGGAVDVAIDSQGNIYVPDSSRNRILVYDGQSWSIFANSNTAGFSRLNSIAIDDNDTVYVGYTIYSGAWRGRISYYDQADGQWKIFANSDAQNLLQPPDIEFDALGKLYVADYGNNRILSYTDSTWSTFYSNITHPNRLLVGPQGHVYVSYNGTFVDEIDPDSAESVATYSNNFSTAQGIVFDLDGNMYVANQGSNTIHRYDGEIWTIYGGNDGLGQFHTPQEGVLDSQGNFYVADVNNGRIQKFDGENWTEIELSYQGSSFVVTRLAVNPSDELFAADSVNNRVMKYTDGVWEPYNYDSDEQGIGSIGDIAFDSSGRLYAVDYNSGNIRMDSDPSWPAITTPEGGFTSVNALAIDSQNNVYVIDGCRIGKFDGTSWSFFSSEGQEVGQLYWPLALTFDASDNLYVADTNNYRIQKFDGTIWEAYGSKGHIPGRFQDPNGIAVSSATNKIYVVEGGNRVQILTYIIPATPTPTVAVEPTATATPSPTSTPTPITPTTLTSSNQPSFNSSSNPSAPACTALRPLFKSELFEIRTTKNSAKLFFTPLPDTSDFYISFSEKAGAEEHGELVSLIREGVQSHTIYHLKPNTIYFAKVRGQNGCMPGDWSNTLTFKTNNTTYYKNLISQFSSFRPKLNKTIAPAVISQTPPTPTPTTISPKPTTPSITQVVTPTLTPEKKCLLWWCW